MAQELTPWFPANVKPARKGIYQVSCREEWQSGRWYARFNGAHWSPNWVRLDEEQRPKFLSADSVCNSNFYLKTWRGLAKDPK